MRSNGVRTVHGPAGALRQVDLGGRSSGGEIGNRIGIYKLSEVLDNYLVGYRVKKIDKDFNFTVSTSASFIAKTWKLRNYITQETILGETITYEYTDYTTRVATFTEGGVTVTETQVVTPPYLTDDVIINGDGTHAKPDLITAVYVPGGTGVTADIVGVGITELTLLEITERAWGWTGDA